VLLLLIHVELRLVKGIARLRACRRLVLQAHRLGPRHLLLGRELTLLLVVLLLGGEALLLCQVLEVTVVGLLLLESLGSQVFIYFDLFL